MTPKGKLLLIGRAEDRSAEENAELRFEPFELLKELLPGDKNDHAIEVITSASEAPEHIKKSYTAAFNKVGHSNISFMHIANKEDGRSSEFERRITKSSAVFFSGGDQFRISTMIGGTLIDDIIKDKYMHDKNFVVAGMGAGAMAIPEIMIWEGGCKESLMDSDLKTTAGLGLSKQCIIDTHFIKHGRFGRLAHAIALNPAKLGIGLGEDTALVIENGTDAICHGPGMIVFIDGKSIIHSNITATLKNCPIYIDNLKVHLLANGCRFSLELRELYQPEMA
ncbi:MAG: cyanophycinase [Bacteroidota bacterium]|nr:cyanophycinase [Bacteroidota bacterium]